ncbi:MAG: asparaginase domain-containing protein [Flavobacteriaceae bacterium]|nr:asparaginase domain-containing protein [Flavobacteriaceae bacterium]
MEKTHLPEMLKWSRCQLNTNVETLMMLDSLEMTVENLERIITAYKNTLSNRIVITHGTDRMAQTAAAHAKA